MKLIIGVLFFTALSAHAALKVECSAGESKFIVTAQTASDIKVTYKGETVYADGILTSDEVDLVAKFQSIGEMTLFAKVGKADPQNYIFTQGQRISVVCR